MKEKIAGFAVALITMIVTIVLMFYFTGMFIVRDGMKGGNSVKVSGDSVIQFDETLGFVARPASASKREHPRIGLSYELFTDQTGARVSQVDEVPLESELQLMTIGCSFTWGHGVSNDETFARVLQNKLGSRVRNYGMGSYGGVQSLKYLERHGKGSQIIIYGFIDDHLRRDVTPCASTYSPYCLRVPVVEKKSDGTYFITSKIELNNVDSSAEFMKMVAQGNYYSLNNVWLGYVKWKDMVLNIKTNPDEQLMTKEERLIAEHYVINQMAEVASRQGAKLVVVNVDVQSKTDNFQKISEMKYGDNVYFVNATNFPEYSGDQLVIASDGHPNALGHKLIAGKIYEFLKALN